MFRFLDDPDVRSSARTHRSRLIIAFAAMVGRGLLGLAAPFYMGKAVDAIILREAPETLRYYVVMLLSFSIGTAFCQWWMRWLWIGWSREAELLIRGNVFNHVVRLPASFFNRSRTGDIMSRLTSDIEATRMGFGPGVMHLTHPIIMTAGAVILMVQTSPMLTAVSMTPLVLLFFVMRQILPGIHLRAQRVQERQAALSTRAQETFSGARVVKAFARETHEEARFADLSHGYFEDSLAHAKSRGLFQCAIEWFAGLGTLVIFVFAGYMVIDSKLTVGDYVAFTGYLGLLIWPMIAMGWTLALFKRAEAAQERIHTLRDEVPEERGEPDRAASRVGSVKTDIEIRDLNYRYEDGDTNVLRDISLKIPVGSTTAIVGPTASGKTSLVSLLPRLSEPPRGSIFIAGQDIRDVPLDELRGQIALVAQEAFLFSDTIGKNIAFGRDHATEAQIAEAARLAGLDTDLETFPRGFDTIVGERGVTLSGGQRQRTAIARALVMDSPILILDDSLSAIDTETEKKILQRLKPVFENRTVIIVAHRLSGVVGADHIVVLNEGAIAEQGSHDELMKLNGHYARIWNLQQEQEELEGL